MHSNEINTNQEEDVNKGATEPFKVTKEGIDYLIQKYLNRKMAEEVDYIEKLDGVKFFVDGLCTSLERGLADSDDLKDKRIEEFDSNEAPPKSQLSSVSFI